VTSGLLFIRHAATDLAGTFCGHADPPINALGQLQIAGLVASLASTPIRAVTSSDLQRAVATAQAIADDHAAPLTIRPALREISFGDWEGLRWADIEARDPVFANEWMSRFPELPTPGGERFVDFEARILHEVDLLLPLAQDSLIAVVTHAGVLRVVLQSLLGCTAQQAWERTGTYCCTVHYAGPTAATEPS
jgi:alpha-ribazole phosphatase/probable phosphoglycerate mutase